LVRETTENWMEKYGQFKQYIEVNGNALVPQTHPELGRWVEVQRLHKKRDKLQEERIQLLNILGFSWDPFADLWKIRCQELKQYTEDNGSIRVSENYPVLGRWVKKQRSKRKNGQLSEDQIQMLNDIGFIWEPFAEPWQKKYQELKNFIEHNGSNEVSNHSVLRVWCRSQRSERKEGKLSEERIQLLDKIGFIWGVREERWQEKYQLLKKYINHNGDAKVPDKHPTLGTWVRTQRRTKRVDQLSQERIQLLDKIGFIWDPPRGCGK
ncbi:helicase associated domain-containing protein, partial [Synechococcus sp. WH 5701]|uniref:helicase associated domain-containing protein n=2 Tax=unclassified Synechococcus TaxID=2626047 RepID=UPI0018DEC4C4